MTRSTVSANSSSRRRCSNEVPWVRPQIVVKVTYLTWTEDNLLRQVSYQGQREDTPARQVVRRGPQL